MANPGERDDIELALKVAVEVIVRGEGAKDHKAVKWYKRKTVLTNVGSALAGIGLVSPVLSAVQDQEVSLTQILKDFVGVPMVLLILGVAGWAIAKKFYESGDVERKAILALGLSDSFRRLRTELESKLPYPDPRSQFGSIVEAGNALERLSDTDLMPNANDCQPLVDDELQKLVGRFSPYWETKRRVERR